MTCRLSRALRKLGEINIGKREAFHCKRYSDLLDRTISSMGIEYAGHSAAFRKARNLYCRLRNRPLDSIDASWCNEAL